MLFIELGLTPYRQAWAAQEEAHERVVAGEPERALLVEHPPVITFGRRPEAAENLLASRESLGRMNVELVQSDRGGDITYHGPGQLVVYPIVRLNDHRLSVGGYVRTLERVVVATLADFDIRAGADPSAVGVWTRDTDVSAKICAIGVRVRRGVSLHGLALNVTCDLSGFDLIVPCGLAGRPVTSMRRLLGDRTPTIDRVKQAIRIHLQNAFPSA